MDDMISRTEAMAMVAAALRMAANYCSTHAVLSVSASAGLERIQDDACWTHQGQKYASAILSITPADAAAALDAVRKVKVKPLDWRLNAGKDGVYYSAYDPLYGREVEAPDEETCDAISRNREARILAALEISD